MPSRAPEEEGGSTAVLVYQKRFGIGSVRKCGGNYVGQFGVDDDQLDIGTELYEKEAFLRLLGEDIARARAEERCYSVLAVVPQHLPGENVRAIVEVAAACLQDLMRDNDLVGRLDDDVLALGLRDTDSVEAGVVSFRLQGDLRLKSYHLRNTVWEPGVASLGDNGETTKDLVNAAIDAAKHRRRRLG